MYRIFFFILDLLDELLDEIFLMKMNGVYAPYIANELLTYEMLQELSSVFIILLVFCFNSYLQYQFKKEKIESIKTNEIRMCFFMLNVS